MSARKAHGTKEMPVWVEHEPGSPGRSAAAHCKSERVHRVAAGEVNNRFSGEAQRKETSYLFSVTPCVCD
jgi:hypothetical protein